MTSLDVTKAPYLTELGVRSNKLTNLDLSQNKFLGYTNVGDNQLSNVTMGDVKITGAFRVSRNQISLKDLRGLLKSVDFENGGEIMMNRQVLPERLALVNRPVDLSGDTSMWTSATKITVWRDRENNIPALTADYTISGNTVTFKKLGEYEVVLMHDSLSYYSSNDAYVAIPYVVDLTNADLSSLTVSTGTLTPTFNPLVTNYTVSVPNNVTEITFTTATFDAMASVAGDGTRQLNVGANNFNIVVTSESPTTSSLVSKSTVTKTYTIVVTRESGSSIQDLDGQTPINVHPNPVTDVLHIQTGDLNVPDVKIFNTNGTLVMQGKAVKFDVSHLPQGLYIVWVNGTSVRVIKR
jgi:hypothetical protein